MSEYELKLLDQLHKEYLELNMKVNQVLERLGKLEEISKSTHDMVEGM